jgi:starch synthase
MKIGIVTSEAVPFAKSGGLADVAGTLFNVYHTEENEIYLFMPMYKTIKNIPSDLKTEGSIAIQIGSQKMEGQILSKEIEKGKTLVLIKQDHYFGRDNLYGTKQGDYPDNAERFGYFALAVLKAVDIMGINIDILHLNDWQTGLIPLFIKDKRLNIKTLFTIHNLGYQGNFPQGILDLLHIDRKYFSPDKIEFYNNVSFLKSGIVYSDFISTVSPTYAKEIRTKEYGVGMDGILNARKNTLIGILNGIDYSLWSPETDQLIYKNYSIETVIDKEENKIKLGEEFNFDVKGKPLYGLVGRLAGQKGIDILADALNSFLNEDIRVIILGTGEKELETALLNLQKKHPDKLKALIKFDEATAHKIYAASDFFMMPSRYEPCGLGQLISLKYGTLPIVRETGGLKDTVDDYNEYTHCGNGISFSEPCSDDFLEAMQRAKKIYSNEKLYKQLQQNAMQCDFSWKRSADIYMKLFKQILQS